MICKLKKLESYLRFVVLLQHLFQIKTQKQKFCYKSNHVIWPILSLHSCTNIFNKQTTLAVAVNRDKPWITLTLINLCLSNTIFPIWNLDLGRLIVILKYLATPTSVRYAKLITFSLTSDFGLNSQACHILSKLVVNKWYM